MDADARRIIEELGLEPHPEGSFYRETYRAPLAWTGLVRGPRSASTAIYTLLPAGEFGAFHRVASDEVWHHYDGDPLELHLIDEGGMHSMVVLGCNLAAGERPQHVVPAGVWQAAIPRGDRYALCGCTVAPGFDFQDFELPDREQLLARFPHLAGVVRKLTRSRVPL